MVSRPPIFLEMEGVCFLDCLFTVLVVVGYSDSSSKYDWSIAAEFSTPEKPRFVAGSIGPTTKLPTLLHIDFDTMKQSFIEQIAGLYDGGADLLLVETCQDVLQIKVALNAIAEFFDKKTAEGKPRIPVMVSVTMETTGTMLVGSDIFLAGLTFSVPPSHHQKQWRGDRCCEDVPETGSCNLYPRLTQMTLGINSSNISTIWLHIYKSRHSFWISKMMLGIAK